MLPDLILFDRDGTLIDNVPYNGDPAAVLPTPGAREALQRLRVAGIPLGIVTNQSGIGRGLLTPGQVEAVNAQVLELLGPFDGVYVCPHPPYHDCPCRKPRPGLIVGACERTGVPPHRCLVVGDSTTDIQAAHAAGANALRVRPQGPMLTEIADSVLSGQW